MLRFKGFSAADITTLEEQVNTWLLHAEPDVKMMEQTVTPAGAITVGFLYDEGFLASEQRLSVEAVEIVEEALKAEPVLEPLKVDQEQV